MKKTTVYTNKDNADFQIEDYLSVGKPIVQLDLVGQNVLYFLDMDEINDFCQILQEKGKQTFDKCFNIEDVQ